MGLAVGNFLYYWCQVLSTVNNPQNSLCPSKSPPHFIFI